MQRNDRHAVVAKVHSLFGQRLDIDDYNQLLQKRSVGEIAGYLKSETYYSQTLAEVKEDLVHREQLESLLKRRELEIYQKLNRYVSGDGIIITMYRGRHEINQILHACRLLNAQKMEQFIVDLPVYLTKDLSIDLFKIAQSKNFDDLQDAIEGTDYYQVIGPYRPKTSDEKIDLVGIETALLSRYYKRMIDFSNSTLNSATANAVNKYIEYLVASHNIGKIYRMKRFFKMRGQDIEPELLPIKTKVRRAVYDELLAVNDYTQMLEILKRHKLDYLYPCDADLSPEMIVKQSDMRRFKAAKHQFRQTQVQIVNVLAYIVMLQIEIANIIIVIEGVRYNVPSEQIKANLVL